MITTLSIVFIWIISLLITYEVAVIRNLRQAPTSVDTVPLFDISPNFIRLIYKYRCKNKTYFHNLQKINIVCKNKHRRLENFKSIVYNSDSLTDDDVFLLLNMPKCFNEYNYKIVKSSK